jgi:hypothetical protein
MTQTFEFKISTDLLKSCYWFFQKNTYLVKFLNGPLDGKPNFLNS